MNTDQTLAKTPESIEYPTAGQRWVEARYLRNQARREARPHRSTQAYLLDNGPDDIRFAANHQVAAELWERVEVMAQEEMDRWREEAKQYDIEWGEDA